MILIWPKSDVICSAESPVIVVNHEDSLPSQLAKPASVQGLDHKLSQIEEKHHIAEEPRIQLRILPLKKHQIVLRLTNPKPRTSGKRRIADLTTAPILYIDYYIPEDQSNRYFFSKLKGSGNKTLK